MNKKAKVFNVMKKIIKTAAVIAILGFFVFLAVELVLFMKPDVRIGYDAPVGGYDPEKGYLSKAMVNFNSRSIFGENKKIRQKAWEFGEESGKLFLELFNKYTAPIVLVEEVRNEKGGMVVTFDGWGTLPDGTIEDIHTEKRFDYIVTDNIDKRELSASELVASFEKPYAAENTHYRNPLMGDSDIYPTVMVDGRLYEWRRGRALHMIPQDGEYYGEIIHADVKTPTKDCEFVSYFSVSGQIFTVPENSDSVYLRLTTDWMEDQGIIFDLADSHEKSGDLHDHKKEIENKKLLRNINCLLMKYYPEGSWDEREGEPEGIYERELTWNEIIGEYGKENIYIITDAFVFHGISFLPFDMNCLNLEEKIIEVEFEHIKGYLFLGDSETNSLFGYIKQEAVPYLFGTDLITAENSPTEGNMIWEDGDVSAMLFTLIQGKYLYAGGAGGWSNLLEVSDDGSFNGVYKGKTLTADNPEKDAICKCEYSGLFDNVTKVSAYCYSLSVAQMEYPAPDSEYFEDGVSFISCIPYGIADSKDILVFLPGCKDSDIPDEALNSFNGVMDLDYLFLDNELITFAIFCETDNSGFVLWEW